MPLVYDIDYEKDPIYIEGYKQGIMQGMAIKSKIIIGNCLLSKEFSVERIANLVGISIDIVLKIQEQLKKRS